jgi:AcrR family transcriptional regulator
MPDASSSIRGRILDAAFAAFMRSGYQGASTAEIARLARVSKRDLYAHFPGKQAMLAACVIERSELLRAPLNLTIPTTPAALRATLVQYGKTVVCELTRPEVIATYRLAVLNAESAPEVAETLNVSGRTAAISDLAALLRAVCEQGLLTGADPEEMAEVFYGVLMKGALLIRLLMRVAEPPAEADAWHRAELAATSLIRLYENEGEKQDHAGRNVQTT